MCCDLMSMEDCNVVEDTSKVNEGTARVPMMNGFGLVLLGGLL